MHVPHMNGQGGTNDKFVIGARRAMAAYLNRSLTPAEMAAALASGSAPRPSLPQPWAWVLPLVLGSASSRFEATHQPSSGRPETEDLRPNPLTGTATAAAGSWGAWTPTTPSADGCARVS